MYCKLGACANERVKSTLCCKFCESKCETICEVLGGFENLETECGDFSKDAIPKGITLINKTKESNSIGRIGIKKYVPQEDRVKALKDSLIINKEYLVKDNDMSMVIIKDDRCNIWFGKPGVIMNKMNVMVLDYQEYLLSLIKCAEAKEN